MKPAQSTLLALVLITLTHQLSAQETEPYEPRIHWAYASFFGTGWYKINDQRSGFIIRAPLRWDFGEAKLDDDGKRSVAYTLRLPFTLGLNRLDFDDVPGTVSSDNLATASANASLDVDIPITQRFHIRPIAEVGYSTVIDESDWAWTYRAEVKTRWAFEAGKLDWSLLLDLGVVGYEPNQGQSDYFEFAAAGLEFGYPISWFSSPGSQSMLYWHVGFTDFIDEIEVQTGVEEFDSVANYWQVGIAMGKRDERVRIWRFSFDRLGLAYKASSTSELRGIKFIFRSLYDL